MTDERHPGATTSTAPLRSPQAQGTVVVGVRADAPPGEGPVTEVVAGRLIATVGELPLPGWRGATMIGDVEALATPPQPGEWLGGLWAYDDGEGRVGLQPVRVGAVVRGLHGDFSRMPGFGAWVMLSIFVGFFFWALIPMAIFGVVQVLRHRGSLSITRTRVSFDAGGDSFVVDAPFKLRAKLRFTRGSESGKRKVRASLVVVAGEQEQSVPFASPEALLRFATAVTATTGLPVRRDVKVDGVRLEQPPF